MFGRANTFHASHIQARDPGAAPGAAGARPPAVRGSPPPRRSGRGPSVAPPQVYTPQTVSFEVTLKKGMSTSKRTLVVELHKHVVTQLMGTSGAERKVNPCREYARMKRKGAEMEVILDDGHGHRRKKYVTFRSAQEALSFEQLLTLDNAVGDQLQYIFNLLDKDCSGRISAEDLRLSLTAEGMDASAGTVAAMMALGTRGNSQGRQRREQAELCRERAGDLVDVELPATPRGVRAPRRASGTRGELAADSDS